MGGNSSKTLDNPNASSWLEISVPREETLSPEEQSLNGYLCFEEIVLPEELLERVLLECSVDVIRTASQVCRLWKDITVDQVFWIRKFAMHGLDFDTIPARILDNKNAWIALQAAVKSNLFTRNLIRNHSGELGTFDYWERDCVPGLLAIESPIVGCPPPPPDPIFGPTTSAFVCSHDYYSMSQPIDLWREGLTPSVMEVIGPFEIRFSVIVGTRADCGGRGHFNVVFGEVDGPRRALCEVEIETMERDPWQIFSFAAFFDLSHPRIHNSVRYFEFGLGGKDIRYWEGHFGLKFARASMTIKLLSAEELENPDPNYHRFPVNFQKVPLTL